MKQSPKASRFVLALFSAGLVSLSFACAPQGGTGPGASSAPAANTPVLQGTVSGGGGNGCKAKTFELDAKRISTLPEYQYVLKPLLRRIEEQGGDPFLTYLLWAAEEKVWYFVPCQLQKLSTEQVGVAIQSDQLALHGEHGIYIYSDPELKTDASIKSQQSYAQQDLKTKAGLLLHEMVMGARLLMKQTAKKQCTALAKKDTTLCSDPQTMAIAEASTVDPKQALIMDAADHEAVRAMTVFLSETAADLSAESIKSTRERLGFNFPWSRAASALTFEGLIAAIARSRQLDDRYVVAGTSHYRGEPTSCAFATQMWSKHDGIYFATEFASPHRDNPVDPNLSGLRKRVGLEYFGQICSDRAGRFQTDRFMNRECTSGSFLTWYGEGLNFELVKGRYESRGVLIDGEIFDEISDVFDGGKFDGRSVEATRVRVLVTREQAPRVHSVHFEPKQILKPYSGLEGTSADDKKNAPATTAQPELLDIPNLAPVDCVRMAVPAAPQKTR